MFPIDTQDKQFHDGDGISELGTILPAWFLNQMQDELIAVIASAGMAPDRNNTQQVIKAISYLIETSANQSAPSGAVMYFARDTAPDGWLKANGASVSRKEYANLFAVIGTQYGKGDGKTTFNMPDFRGEFFRALDDGRNIDANRKLGSYQGDAIRNIVAKIDSAHRTQQLVESWSASGAFYFSKTGFKNWTADAQDGGENLPWDISFDASRVVPTANENRPRNIALLACIKA